MSVSLDILSMILLRFLRVETVQESRPCFNVIAQHLLWLNWQHSYLGENVTHFHQKSRQSTCLVSFRILRWEQLRGWVAENLLIAKFRGEKRGLVPRGLNSWEGFRRRLKMVMVWTNIWIRRLNFYLVGKTGFGTAPWQHSSDQSFASGWAYCSTGS